MSDPHGLFPRFDRQPTEPADAPQLVHVEPALVDSLPTEPAHTELAPTEPAHREPVHPEPDAGTADGFDRGRVLRLLDRLERDVAAVETAMVHVEAGEHEAYSAAVSVIEAELVD